MLIMNIMQFKISHLWFKFPRHTCQLTLEPSIGWYPVGQCDWNFVPCSLSLSNFLIRYANFQSNSCLVVPTRLGELNSGSNLQSVMLI